MTSKTRPAVLDFTNDEHLVLSHWFDVAPDVEASETPELAIALDRMGFSEHVLDLYNRQQAAVASILLERIDRRLPQWSAGCRMSDGSLFAPDRWVLLFHVSVSQTPAITQEACDSASPDGREVCL
jgi:hypothetical protein